MSLIAKGDGFRIVATPEGKVVEIEREDAMGDPTWIRVSIPQYQSGHDAWVFMLDTIDQLVGKQRPFYTKT